MQGSIIHPIAKRCGDKQREMKPRDNLLQSEQIRKSRSTGKLIVGQAPKLKRGETFDTIQSNIE